jgi:glycosyltransferase involved in cell wall biosynthesis
MRVLVVSCVFPPEPVVSSLTSENVAADMARRGHEVTVITTFPNRPSGKIFKGYSRWPLIQSRRGRGYRIIRCFSFFSKHSNILSRFVENIYFGLSGGLAALTLRRPDVIYTNTWPIISTGIVSLVSRLRRIPLVISVQDLYPESLISQKRIKENGRLARFLLYGDSRIVRGSRGVIAISRRFREACLKRGVAEEKLHVIPNWGESEDGAGDETKTLELRTRLGLGVRNFLCAYGGNISAASGIETVLQAFAGMKDAGEARFLIAGEGSRLPACRELARRNGDRRILFYCPWPKEDTLAVLGAADVLILPTRGHQSLVSVPSKLISYMLSARPVIALAHPDSDLSEIIAASECGWVIEPGQPGRLAEAIRGVMALSPEERRRIGQCGRRYALANLTRQSNLPRLIEILERAAETP